MYSDAFCKVYNEFGWNYFPEAFGEQLLAWLELNHVVVKTSLDLGCGTGVLCEILHAKGVKSNGMDFSEGMIEIAKKRNPDIFYEVADMIKYRPEKKFDLVTCTGDALNHIMDLKDVDQIFQNIHGYLNEGGYFIFDLFTYSKMKEFSHLTIKDDLGFAKYKWKMNVKNNTIFHKIKIIDGKTKITEKYHEYYHDLNTILDPRFKVISVTTDFKETYSEDDERILVVLQK